MIFPTLHGREIRMLERHTRAVLCRTAQVVQTELMALSNRTTGHYATISGIRLKRLDHCSRFTTLLPRAQNLLPRAQNLLPRAQNFHPEPFDSASRPFCHGLETFDKNFWPLGQDSVPSTTISGPTIQILNLQSRQQDIALVYRISIQATDH